MRSMVEGAWSLPSALLPPPPTRFARHLPVCGEDSPRIGALRQGGWQALLRCTISAKASPADLLNRTMNPAEDGLPKPQRYWAILTLMVGLAMSCLDTAIVNIALPSIAKDLHTSAADSIWVVNAYQLAVMIALLPFASFGDIFGYG